MAIRKPLYYNDLLKTFTELTDSQLERVSYAIRKGYSLELISNNENIGGKITIGIPGQTGYTSIGTATNTITRELTQSLPNDDVPPGDNNFPATLSSAYHVNFQTSYNYRQKNPGNIAISWDEITNYSYLIWNNVLKGMQIEGVQQNIIDTIISDARYQIQYGDRVGGYHVGKTPPSDGGTWVSKGTIFTDTSYWNASENFQLYVKTAASNENTILYDSSVNDSAIRYGGISGSNPILSNVNLSDWTNTLYEYILTPLLEYKCPKYTFSKISGDNSTTASSTWTANYSNTNYGFITERFVLSAYSRYNVVVYTAGAYTGSYYQADFRPQNNSYRYNVWALIPNGNY